MSCLCSSFAYNVLGVVIALCVVIVTYFKWNYTYWKRKNLPYLKPTLFWGTMENPFRRTTAYGAWIKRNYDELKKDGHKHGGIYNFASPGYLVVDPNYIKNVMQNDFQYFIDRGFYYNEKDDPLSAHLFAIGGKKWRSLRTKLTPTFTSGKMKMMFETLVDCSIPMKTAMDKLTKDKERIDIKEIASSYTTDVIGSCAFGLECKSFDSPNAEFRRCGKSLFQRDMLRQTLRLLFVANPSVGNFLKIKVLPTYLSNFFFNVVKDTVNYREQNNLKRNDILQLLTEIKIKNDGVQSEIHDSSSLTMEEIAAQALVFFIAGFETSSTTMTFCLYELAKNPELQQKVRDEINTVLAKHGNKITYDSMSDLTYMMQVIDETLRKYPPVPQITRKCVKNYPVPDTNIVIEKGTPVFIPVYGLHHDPEYFPNPEKFDPERFSEENKKERLPFTYMPFGDGPRVCIGLRFGVMQAKVGLTVLLKNYEFSLSENMPNTIGLNRSKLLLDSEETIWLRSKPVK